MKDNQVVLYIAMSLDGYIAKKDGSVAWLHDVEGDGGDNGYEQFYSTIGALVMGRSTYSEVLELAEEFPYQGKPCYVISRTLQGQGEYVQFTSEPLETLIPRIRSNSSGDVWLVGGGKLVQAFLENELLDRLMITVIPKILGDGIPLFPQGTLPSTWRVKEVEKLGQIVMLTYVK